MKAVKYIICIAAIVSGLGFAANAATSKEKLISSLYRQQKETEKQIVKMWMNDKRGEEMEKLLGEYVTREIRLQAMTGKTKTRTLLSEVTINGEGKCDSPVELARAIVVEYLKGQGIDIKKCTYVHGEYMIRKSCLSEEFVLE